jgi:hypothetical protein
MLLDDIKNLKTGPRELRKFGLMVGGVFVVLGLLLLFRSRAAGPYLLGIGGVLVVFGAASPQFLKPVYVAWMSVAFALGFVVSHVILTLFFFLVITPVGLVARIFGKDFLRLKLDRNAPSYWVRRKTGAPKPASHYEQQF